MGASEHCLTPNAHPLAQIFGGRYDGDLAEERTRFDDFWLAFLAVGSFIHFV